MHRNLFTVLLMLFPFAIVCAQTTKSVTNENQIWLGYFNQTRLTNKIGLWLDLHVRTKEEFTNSLSQIIIRPGITYHIDDNTRITLGYAYVNNYPAEGHNSISQPEHRMWQQFQWHTDYTRTKLTQAIRLEEKYKHKILNDSTLADGFNFNYKIRYNLTCEVPFSRLPTNKFSFILNNEVHINFGKEIIYNYFDQNRFFVGFKVNIRKHDNLQLGYMNRFQQLPSGNKYRNNNIIRLFYLQNFDFRRKKLHE